MILGILLSLGLLLVLLLVMWLLEMTATTATKTMKVGAHQEQDDGCVEHNDDGNIDGSVCGNLRGECGAVGGALHPRHHCLHGLLLKKDSSWSCATALGPVAPCHVHTPVARTQSDDDVSL